jgi:hypothetical protein
MPRLPHGLEMIPATLDGARNAVAASIAGIPLGPALVKPVDRRRFDYLFLDLQDDPDNLLPVSQQTRDSLVALGEAMADQGADDPAGDSAIPAAYTYLGQFVDHDITLEVSSATGSQLTDPDLQPLPLNRIRQETHNLRTALLELDSVYGLPAERDPGPNDPKMRIGTVQPVGPPVPGKDAVNDLPREGRSVDVVHDRAALIGDPRNDENLIIAQLHVAFLRAHNRLVDEADPPDRFRKAKRRLRRHYQHIVLHDFLRRIADRQIVRDTIQQNRVYDPDFDNFFLPLEYSVAAYRFGHSMIRAEYDYNVNFNSTGRPNTSPATLARLFVFTAFSGEIVGLETLPQNWIIQWENFFPGVGEFFNEARRIDTELVEPLEHLTIVSGQEEGGLAAKLAVRNLLRGYLMRLPTGQAVARALRQRLHGVRDIPVLTAEQIRQEAERDPLQIQALEAGEFLERTPLWYYILAEAAILGDGQHLGPVGSTIVAEVLVGLVRRSPDSILEDGLDWEPNLPSAQPGTFNLPDLLRFAGVLA